MNMNSRPQNNNNRRRGRGNNNNNGRPQNNNNRSGLDYQNQIDNRARGNASQMLEKYKKLASDAELIGDRVNGEYYLQFADHYFRVLADFRARQEARAAENPNRRPQRDDSRDEWQNEESRDAGDDAPSNIDGDNGADAESSGDEHQERAPRNANPRRPQNNGQNSDRQPRQPRAPRRHHSEEERDNMTESGFDLSVLPPSIAISSDDDTPVDFSDKPARKPRARKPKAIQDDVAAVAAE